MKIGILTSGGDCPGLNAVIRGAVLKGVISHDAEFVGFRWGWKGVVERDIMPITRHDVRGLSKQGGTILGSSRTNPFEGEQGGPENIRRMLDEEGIDAIVASPRPSTTTSPRPTTPSASTRPSRSPPRRSTGCAPRPSRTTARWCSRSWAATSAGSRCTRAWRAARMPS
jgi:hypothetical protein